MLPMKVFLAFSCPRYSLDEKFLWLNNFIKLIWTEVNLNTNITHLASNDPVTEHKSFCTSELQDIILLLVLDFDSYICKCKGNSGKMV